MDKLKQDITFETTLQGEPFTFVSTWGLFSPKGIDEGTQLLIDALQIRSDDDNLDLGCGYGAIGLAMAKLSPQGHTHLVDKDFVGIEYAKKNAELNHIENAEIYLSNGFSHVPIVRFNTIASNLPAKVGKELYTILFDDAKAHLKPGGQLYVVTIRGLREYIKREFKERFGNYEKIAENKNYTVSMAKND